jgi:hypothetical protein
MSQENAQTLLADLGKQLGLDDIDLDENNFAAVAFDEVVVNFEFDSDTGQLAFYSEIGKPPAPDQPPVALLEALLKANFFQIGTAGGTIGMDREKGFISFFQSVDPDAIKSDEFFTTVETFVDLAEGWTARIVDLAAENEAEGNLDPTPDNPEAMIRI